MSRYCELVLSILVTYAEHNGCDQDIARCEPRRDCCMLTHWLGGCIVYLESALQF